MSFCSVLFCSALLFPVSLFPTSLCEVLVFGSVSCPPPLLFFPPVLRHTNFHTTFSYTRPHFCHTHNFVTHTHLCHTQLCHTPSFTHNFVTHIFVTHNFVTLHLSHTTLSHTFLSHTTWSHTSLSHTAFSHTTLSHTTLSHTHTHTPSFTLNFVIHILSHTTLSQTIFVTQLGHTHVFGTHTELCHTHTHTQLCHTHNFVTHTHTIFHTQLCHTHIFVTQLGHTHLCHTQLCHTPSLRGWRGGPWRHRLCICVAGVALGDIHLRLRFVWQAWHLATHPRHFVWHACATYGMVARCRAVASQAWHLATSTLHLRGKRVAWRDPPMFAWQAWRLWHWAASGGALQVARAPRHLAWQASHLATSTCTFRSRPGAWRHPPMFCVAGVALMALGWVWWCGWGALRHFAWQVWRLATSTLATFAYVLCGRRGAYGTRRSTLRGRRGTWRHRPWFGVAGVALGDIHLHFAWQAWHLATSTYVLRGRRDTYGYQGRLSYRRVVVV